eukprot:5202265-Alexandrium_andersonii.AAC.1
MQSQAFVIGAYSRWLSAPRAAHACRMPCVCRHIMAKAVLYILGSLPCKVPKVQSAIHARPVGAA